MRSKRISAVLTAAVMMLSFGTAVSAESVMDNVTMKCYEMPEADSSKSGIKVIDGRAFRFDSDGVPSPYTGRIKSSKGVRYYIDGSIRFGWLKISGSWYYFDPSDSGYMAVEKAKTGLGTYYFNSDGKWNGKYSASAKAPSDFSLCLQIKGQNIDYLFDTAENKLVINYFTLKKESYYSKKISIPTKDKQIIYDMLMSCNVDDIGHILDNENLSELTGTEEYEESEENLFFLSAEADGKDISVTGDFSMYNYYEVSSEVQSAAYYIEFIRNYVSTLPAYSSIMKKYED